MDPSNIRFLSSRVVFHRCFKLTPSCGWESPIAVRNHGNPQVQKFKRKLRLLSKHFLPEMDESTPQKTNMTLEKIQFSIGKNHKKPIDSFIRGGFSVRQTFVSFPGRSIKSDPKNLRSRMYKPEGSKPQIQQLWIQSEGFLVRVFGWTRALSIVANGVK